ncbi:MAG: hypothetical protein J2P23_14855, partial [Microlunatus sp.]|nr:hypothetical protein [Microlunatus sp.]
MSGRYSPRARVALIGLAGLVSIAVVGASVVLARIPRDQLSTVTPAGLHVAGSATGSWRIGGIDVVLDPTRLTLTRHGRVLFQSPPGTA